MEEQLQTYIENPIKRNIIKYFSVAKSALLLLEEQGQRMRVQSLKTSGETDKEARQAGRAWTMDLSDGDEVMEEVVTMTDTTSR